MSDNLEFWHKVDETPPGYTKTNNYDGRDVTTIAGTYYVMKATEMWGPIGEYWGYEIMEERFDQGGPMLSSTGVNLGNAIMHTIKLQVWHQDEETSDIIHLPVHFGHTPYVYMTQWGPKTDFDAPKKSLTDALKKSLSMLGFSADVFLGLFEDREYVEYAKAKEQIRQAEDQDQEIESQRTAMAVWVEACLQNYTKVTNASALKITHQANVRKAKRECPLIGVDTDKVLERLNKGHEEARERLTVKVCTECGAENKAKEGEPCSECGAQKSPDEPGKK